MLATDRPVRKPRPPAPPTPRPVPELWRCWDCGRIIAETTMDSCIRHLCVCNTWNIWPPAERQKRV